MTDEGGQWVTVAQAARGKAGKGSHQVHLMV